MTRVSSGYSSEPELSSLTSSSLMSAKENTCDFSEDRLRLREAIDVMSFMQVQCELTY